MKDWKSWESEVGSWKQTRIKRKEYRFLHSYFLTFVVYQKPTAYLKDWRIKKLLLKFSETPPKKAVIAVPVSFKRCAKIALVVVFPCVPATAKQ